MLNDAEAIFDPVWVQPLAAAARALGKVFESGADDVHAGEVETSLVMALSPDAVGDGAVNQVPSAGRDLIEVVPFTTLAPGGVWGRPSLASRAKGDAALAAAADATATDIRENFDTLARMKKGRRALDQ